MHTENAHHTAAKLTRHAGDRLRQRGIGREIVALIEAHHDIAIPVGRGCVSLTVSRRALQVLLAEGLPPRLAERLCSVAAVVEEATGLVVTVMHLHGKSARRYARPGRGREDRARRTPPRRSGADGKAGR